MAFRYQLRGSAQLCFGYELSPQNAQLKANPRHGERRDIPVFPQRRLIDPVGLVELAQIGEQCAEWDQILQTPWTRAAICGRQQRLRASLFRRPDRCSTTGVRRRLKAFRAPPPRQDTPRLGEAMSRRGDLRRTSEVRADSAIGADELTDQNFESVERSQIAKELRCQLLLFDNVFRDTWSLRRAPEPTPGSLACALQIDDGDVPGRRQRKIQSNSGASIISRLPKRFLRASRPVFTRVETMVLTIMVGWPSAQKLHAPLDRAAAPLRLDVECSRVIHGGNAADDRVAIESLRIVDGFETFDDLLAVDRFDRAQLTDTRLRSPAILAIKGCHMPPNCPMRAQT